MKKYKRDKRSPTPSSEAASTLMSRIKAKDTKPEISVRKMLWAKGFRGYRKHYNIPGRPDIVFTRKRIAIFVHGCFWHGCEYCKLRKPKSNSEFWNSKLEKNKSRDALKIQLLTEAGWDVFVIWECDIKEDHRKNLLTLLKKLGSVNI